MAYLKPQSPIKNGEDHVYPLTTYDQIVMSDNSRWDGDVGVTSINGKTGATNLTYSDVSAAAASHTHNYVTNSASTWDGNTLPQDIPNGISYVEVKSTGTDVGFPVSYGVCLSVKISTTRIMQILVNKSNDILYTRAGNGDTAWYNWNKLISAADFSLSGTTLTITTT